MRSSFSSWRQVSTRNLQQHSVVGRCNSQQWQCRGAGRSIQHLAILAVAAGQTVRSVPEDYPTIQAAIDAVDDGDRVLVAAGVYSEALIITKHVEVVGASRDSTVVQTSRFGTACCKIVGGSCMLANIQLKATCVLSEAVRVCCKIDGVLVVDCDTVSDCHAG